MRPVAASHVIEALLAPMGQRPGGKADVRVEGGGRSERDQQVAPFKATFVQIAIAAWDCKLQFGLLETLLRDCGELMLTLRGLRATPRLSSLCVSLQRAPNSTIHTRAAMYDVCMHRRWVVAFSVFLLVSRVRRHIAQDVATLRDDAVRDAPAIFAILTSPRSPGDDR